ncbi:hypothetical protein [Streptomyces sp. AJS327]|nr:hypothetical protein [Streptomyces sp. AJS327]
MKNHPRAIYGKIGVTDRTQAALYAWRNQRWADAGRCPGASGDEAPGR